MNQSDQDSRLTDVELAGPPVGYLPAGMQQPQQSQQSSPTRAGTAAPPSMTGYPPSATASYAASAHTPLGAPSVTPSQCGAWGDPTRGPPARYDGGE